MSNRIVLAVALALAPGCWSGPTHRFVTDIKFSGTELVTISCPLEQPSGYPSNAQNTADESCDEQRSQVTPMVVPGDEVAP